VTGASTGIEDAYVPSAVDGYPVEEIATGTFANCDALLSVEIEEGVKALAYGAFSNCPVLETVILPESVVEIDENAFWDCPHVAIEAPAESFAAAFALAHGLIEKKPVTNKATLSSYDSVTGIYSPTMSMGIPPPSPLRDTPELPQRL
jgi:hypothetical protein